MSVVIAFTCGGTPFDENTALDFGTVQAGTTSAVKTIVVTNTGTSDALSCVVDPKAASIANGFAGDIQSGSANDTYNAQTFAATSGSTYYVYAVLGTGKNYTNKTGGTLANTNGSDSYVTVWSPPSVGVSGAKVWGNVFSCVYV